MIKSIISVLLLGTVTSMTAPAIAYPDIVEPERIVCESISEDYLECDRFVYDTGEFIETYYLNIYTNEYTLENPLGPLVDTFEDTLDDTFEDTLDYNY